MMRGCVVREQDRGSDHRGQLRLMGLSARLGVGGATIAGPGNSRTGARMAETVELATIWLVDLVGSTSLVTAVGPVRADSLLEEYFALLRDAIDASGGRAFKNTGDGLFVAFSSASGAVSCGVLTQQLFERRYRSAEQALHRMSGSGSERVSRRSRMGTISGCRRLRRRGCATRRRLTGSWCRRRRRCWRAGSRAPGLSRWERWS